VRRVSPGTRVVGVSLIVASAFAFATIPIFGKLAYSSGTEPLGLLAWRFGLAAIILLIINAVTARVKKRPAFPPLRLSLTLLAFGAFMLTPEVVLYFYGLQTVSAGLAETLLFLYPAWVVLMSAILFRRKPELITVLCVLGAIVGAAITIGSVSGGSLVGMLLVTGASVTFAAYIVAGSRLLPRVGSLPGTALIITGAGVMFVLLATITGSRGPGDTSAWLGTLGMVLIGTIVSFITLSAGLARISASTASVIATIEPVIAVVLGAVVLGEAVGAIQVVGMVLVLGSVAALLAFESRAAAEGRRPQVAPAPPAPPPGGVG